MATNLGNLDSDAQIPADGLADHVLPLGTVIDWYRASTSTSVPSGWVVCDGTNWNDIDNHMGSAQAKLTTGTIPNLIGKFTMGARPTTTAGGVTAADTTASSNGNAYANAPGIGGVGGSNAAISLAHTHTIAGHGHAHTIATTGAKANVTSAENNGATNNITSYNATGLTVNGETPTTTTQASHQHDYYITGYTTGNLNSSSGSYVRVNTINYSTAQSSSAGSHSHTVTHGHGVTDPNHAHTIYQTNHTHAITGAVGTGTAGDSAMTTGGLSWDTSAVTDMRPAHVGLLKIMKVKIV